MIAITFIISFYVSSFLNTETTNILFIMNPKAKESFWLVASALYLLGKERREIGSISHSKDIMCWCKLVSCLEAAADFYDIGRTIYR